MILYIEGTLIIGDTKVLTLLAYRRIQFIENIDPTLCNETAYIAIETAHIAPKESK